MAGIKKKITGWFHNKAPNFGLPIRTRSGESSTSNNQNPKTPLKSKSPPRGWSLDNNKAKPNEPPKKPRKGIDKEHAFAKRHNTRSATAHLHTPEKRSDLPPKDLSMHRAASKSAAGPSKPNAHGNQQAKVIDLTSDSDDEADLNVLLNRLEASQRRRPPAVEPGYAFRPQQDEVPGQAGMRSPVLQRASVPQQDQMVEDEDEAFARALQNSYAAELPALGQEPPRQSPGIRSASPYVPLDPLAQCIQTLENIFPGICLDHVSELFNTVSKDPEQLVEHLLSKEAPYPRAKDKQLALKRKRELDPVEEAARKYNAPDRVIPAKVNSIRPYIRSILGTEFPLVSYAAIDMTLAGCGHRLFSAYQILVEFIRTDTPAKPTYQRIKKARKPDVDITEKGIQTFLANPNGDQERVEVLEELLAARRFKRKGDARLQAELDAQLLEEKNTREAEANGLMGECKCCYGDFPLNRLVHCNGEDPHDFCRECARRNAEAEVGKSKFELQCMSPDLCKGGFDLEQRLQFLDESTRIALDRNEAEAALRMAGIENLESCPFCPFAAEYPEISINREFHCQAPDCEKVSCRLCKEESHIPKTCEENTKDKGLSIRRQIEEAMSAALIRKCNKCATPFVKEEGCNKMTCTSPGCRNIQCYVCSASCDYSHFDDTRRGGKTGNCPLFESTEERHEGDVSKAEKEALEKIMKDHPEYTAEDLKINMSEKIKKDDEERKARGGRGIQGLQDYREFFNPVRLGVRQEGEELLADARRLLEENVARRQQGLLDLEQRFHPNRRYGLYLNNEFEAALADPPNPEFRDIYPMAPPLEHMEFYPDLFNAAEIAAARQPLAGMPDNNQAPPPAPRPRPRPRAPKVAALQEDDVIGGDGAGPGPAIQAPAPKIGRIGRGGMYEEFGLPADVFLPGAAPPAWNGLREYQLRGDAELRRSLRRDRMEQHLQALPRPIFAANAEQQAAPAVQEPRRDFDQAIRELEERMAARRARGVANAKAEQQAAPAAQEPHDDFMRRMEERYAGRQVLARQAGIRAAGVIPLPPGIDRDAFTAMPVQEIQALPRYRLDEYPVDHNLQAPAIPDPDIPGDRPLTLQHMRRLQQMQRLRRYLDARRVDPAPDPGRGRQRWNDHFRPELYPRADAEPERQNEQIVAAARQPNPPPDRVGQRLKNNFLFKRGQMVDKEEAEGENAATAPQTPAELRQARLRRLLPPHVDIAAVALQAPARRDRGLCYHNYLNDYLREHDVRDDEAVQDEEDVAPAPRPQMDPDSPIARILRLSPQQQQIVAGNQLSNLVGRGRRYVDVQARYLPPNPVVQDEQDVAAALPVGRPGWQYRFHGNANLWNQANEEIAPAAPPAYRSPALADFNPANMFNPSLDQIAAGDRHARYAQYIPEPDAIRPPHPHRGRQIARNAAHNLVLEQIRGEREIGERLAREEAGINERMVAARFVGERNSEDGFEEEEEIL